MSTLDNFFPRMGDSATVVMSEARQGNFSSWNNFQEAKRHGLNMPKAIRIKTQHLPEPVMRQPYLRLRYR